MVKIGNRLVVKSHGNFIYKVHSLITKNMLTIKLFEALKCFLKINASK